MFERACSVHINSNLSCAKQVRSARNWSAYWVVYALTSYSINATSTRTHSPSVGRVLLSYRQAARLRGPDSSAAPASGAACSCSLEPKLCDDVLASMARTGLDLFEFDTFCDFPLPQLAEDRMQIKH